LELKNPKIFDKGGFSMKNTSHPELREGEVWITNADEEGYSSVGWKTKRKGQVAYGRDGKPVMTYESFFPVFAQRKELEDAGITIED
jgi:hypothetical protein